MKIQVLTNIYSFTKDGFKTSFSKYIKEEDLRNFISKHKDTIYNLESKEDHEYYFMWETEEEFDDWFLTDGELDYLEEHGFIKVLEDI